MPDIRVTDREQFKQCRRKSKYQRLWEIVPVQEKRGALWIGSGVHHGLAAYYKDKTDPWEAAQEWLLQKMPQEQRASLWPEEVSEFNGILNLITEMLVGYVPWAEKNDDFRVVTVETPIRIKVQNTRTYLAGTLDVLVRRNNLLWVMDHKTAANFISPETLELDDQMTAYTWLVWQAYGSFGGAVYNQLRKKVPAEPALLASGKALSKNKSIDTTYDRYMSAIESYDLDPADYEDILSILEHNEFFRREYVARSKYELQHFGSQLTHEVREMNSKHTNYYPHPTRDCSWACSYRDLCIAETTGGDVQALIKYNYEHAEGGRRTL